ncbi:lipopolysaccharide assembly protein LapB [Acidobacterium sp. S8]|uniref:tetratricopeptide repeat protein n=1 Tax=Acidobacterium sp. S8 TaxID=1641854 RepID=UPI00131D5740|nr:tetratricopeptide repeat protein [Acidobacterium sp. S8]
MRLVFRIFVICVLACAAIAVNADVPPDQLLSVRNALTRGHADEGLQALNQVLSTQPGNAEAYNLRCRIYMQEQRWNDAIPPCQSAVKLSPGTSNYHLWLARALGEKADRVSFITAFRMAKQIRQEFETAAKLDPHNAAALSDLAEFYVDAPAIVGGGIDKAGAVAQQLDTVAPDRAHYIRGRIAENAKDYGRAETEYKAVIAGAKDPADAWMELASFYRRQERWGDMIQAVHTGASLDANKGVALADGASVLIRAGRDLPFARQLLEQYLASPNKSEDAPAFKMHVQLGTLLSRLGDSSGAQQQFAASAELAKDYQAGTQAATNTGR